MKFLITVACLLTVFCIQSVEAGFYNNGRMQSRNLNLSVRGTLDNNGELIGAETANLVCDTLSGKGLIRSPQISIQTKVFAYTGTIDCDGSCVIISSTPFDEKMFKRTGKGEFAIVIDESLGKADIPTPKALRQNDDYEIRDELLFSVE